MAAQKKINNRQKNVENVPTLEIVEDVFLVQCKSADNQSQQKSEILYTFTPNKSHPYLLNVKTSNLVFSKNYNIEFDEVIITFTDQNGRHQKKIKFIWHCLLINRNNSLIELSNTTIWTENTKTIIGYRARFF